MSELRAVQNDVETLRNRVDGISVIRNVRELHEGQDALTTSTEFMHRITSIEERIGLGGGVITENVRECKVRLDRRTAGIERLHQRVRTQDWYHDLSEQESSDESHRMVDVVRDKDPIGLRRRGAPLQEFR